MDLLEVQSISKTYGSGEAAVCFTDQPYTL